MTNYSGRGLHGQVVEEIGRRILDGRIAESATIDITALEAEFGVSLTVVREALRVLGAKGLVDARQKRGTFVRPRDSWNLLDADIIRWQLAGRANQTFLDDLAEVRLVIEPSAARLAASRHGTDDLRALRAALADMGTATGPDAAVAADLRFHRALLAATHNELLRRMEVVLATGLAERDRLVHGAERADDPLPSHAAVVDAVAAGDPDAAEAAMRRLLDQAGADLHRVTHQPQGEDVQ
ncbi:FadR family transcriptional regulator (plasmid) [Embleya sp. NBC_00888]|uniref:FadR/GntR family transcriptional regulator n=1 Tax=Embleya sp. NBC_00888 TaxID=2975960 RepID=UPI002F90B273|nr:FadR family transcriptional regulator [Embleya sp. NBC_00888]